MLRASVIFASTLAVVAVVSIAHAGVVEPREAALTIRVVHDLNENRIWDKGEPGLEGWSAIGVCGDVWEWGGTTDIDGEFTLLLRAPGTVCVNFSVEFGWFALTPTRVIVRYEPNEDVEVLLFVRKVAQDAARFSGRLIADGLPAAPDAELEAWVDGQRCGDAQVNPRLGITHYTLYVLGASERSGCATEGADVALTLDGVDAGEVVFEALSRQYPDVIAGPAPMYFPYWYISAATSGPVTPRVGPHACGAAFLEDAFGLVAPNSQEVYVPASGTSGSCGSADAVVSLWAGERVVDQVLWEPGLVARQSSLRHLGDADCDGEVASTDAAVILQYAARLLASISCAGTADVDQDGEVDAVDAALLLQHAAGLLPWFPTE